MKKKICFILNPKAGAGLNNKVVLLISELFDENNFETEIIFTQHPGHAVDLTKNIAEKKIDIVAAVGGDGTVNETAQSLIHSETALAIIPTGSGNGFARHFKIPLNITRAMLTIIKGKVKIIDSLRINEKFCINIAGCGFDGHIAHLFAGYGTRGLNSYAKLVIREYFSFSEKKYTIEFDNKKISRTALLIVAANASQFGNGARIAPLADPADGMIDLTILKKASGHRVLFLLNKIFNGKLATSKYAELIKSKSFIISSDEDIEIHFDGEPVDACKKLTAEVIPLSLKLIVP
jgi:YegS/Rv2252/BmrU family lipid kinase